MGDSNIVGHARWLGYTHLTNYRTTPRHICNLNLSKIQFKYTPSQIDIDASCQSTYIIFIIMNTTQTNVGTLYARLLRDADEIGIVVLVV